jgi:hypothetical protein
LELLIPALRLAFDVDVRAIFCREMAVEYPRDGRWWLVVEWNGVEWHGASHCDKVGAAVLILALVLVDTVCGGGERFVGG